jgi:hypothetical protein
MFLYPYWERSGTSVSSIYRLSEILKEEASPKRLRSRETILVRGGQVFFRVDSCLEVVWSQVEARSKFCSFVSLKE